MKRFFSLQTLMLITLWVTGSQVTAHTLKETNARVILRDGQVEVRLITDIVRWQNLLQNEHAWLLGDIDQVMPKGLDQTQRQVFLTGLLNNKTHLTINSQPVTLAPATAIKSIDEHSGEITLRGQHNIAAVGKVTITFPKSLGSVYVSFVRPQYKMLKSGDTAVASF